MIPDKLILTVNELLQHSPGYRDRSEPLRDNLTCVFCEAIIEPIHGRHRDDCPWIRLSKFKLIEPVCCWKANIGDADCWDSECGESFVFTSSAPTEDGFRFCPYCGREIRVVTSDNGDKE